MTVRLFFRFAQFVWLGGGGEIGQLLSARIITKGVQRLAGDLYMLQQRRRAPGRLDRHAIQQVDEFGCATIAGIPLRAIGEDGDQLAQHH